MTRLTECEVGALPQAWEKIGVHISNDHCVIGDVILRFSAEKSGFISWTFDRSDSSTSDAAVVHTLIDGIPTHLERDRKDPGESSLLGPATILGIDHVVVMTNNLERTCGEVERVLSVACARERDAGNSVRQAFHKLDNTIIEVVTSPNVVHEHAHLWGLVISVDDIDAWCSSVGEHVAGAPRAAVQPGRRISTVRESVGLGIAVAVMTPHVRKR
jgi:hypothetical protein